MSRTKNEAGWLALLQRREGVAGSQACLLNTGIMVEYVVDQYMAGESIEDIAENYLISETLVEAAIRLTLLVRGTNLDTAPARKRLEGLVPIREPYLKAPVFRRGRSAKG